MVINTKTSPKIIISIFGVIGAFMVVIALKTNYIPPWDEAYHLTVAFKYYEAITKLSPPLFIQQLNTNELYPPTYHIITALTYIFWGVRPSAGIIANIPFVFLYLFSLYFIGKKLFNNIGIVVAPMVTIVLPSIVGLYTTALTDFSAIALFTACLSLTLYLDTINTLYYVVVVGFFTLLLSLTRLASLSLVLSLILLQVIFIFLGKKRLLRKCIFSSLVICIPLIALLWYLPKYNYISDTYSFWLNPHGISQQLYRFPSGLTFENLKYYIEAIIYRSGVGIGLPMLYAVSVVWLIIHKKLKRNHFVVFSFIVWIYASQTALQMKGDRYVAGLLGLLAVFGIGFLFSMKNIVLKVAVLLLVAYQIIPGAYNYLYTKISYRNPWNTEALIVNVFGDIKKQSKGLSLSDYQFLNHSTINYYLTINHIPIEFRQAIYVYNPATPGFVDYNSLNNYDFIIIKSGDNEGVLINKDNNNSIKKWIIENNVFTLKYKDNLPDYSDILIFSKN